MPNQIINLQASNTGTGEYDVYTPRPYPWAVDANTGEVGNQKFWRGEPSRVIGFQDAADVQEVSVFWDEVPDAPQSVVGKFPVFLDSAGGMYSISYPIESVTVINAEVKP